MKVTSEALLPWGTLPVLNDRLRLAYDRNEKLLLAGTGFFVAHRSSGSNWLLVSNPWILGAGFYVLQRGVILRTGTLDPVSQAELDHMTRDLAEFLQPPDWQDMEQVAALYDELYPKSPNETRNLRLALYELEFIDRHDDTRRALKYPSTQSGNDRFRQDKMRMSRIKEDLGG